MKPFQFARASNAQSAEQLYKKTPGSFYIAGGTNLVDLMKKDITAPEQLIDINGLSLKEIKSDATGIHIGALAWNSTVAEHPDILKKFPLISKALLAGASPQLRNMATIGGNLMQRTRCPYFYDTAMPCNKRQPGSGCAAKDGWNRTGALFGHSESCVAVHPSDLCIALAALDAKVHVQQNGKESVIAFKDFHRLPGTTPEQDNTLPKGALITKVFVPANGFSSHFHYLKIRDRASYAFALVSVAAALRMEGNTIREARIACGGVAHKPWRLYEVEKFLAGKPASESVWKEAAKLAIKDAKPISRNAFKVPMLENGIVTALKQAIA
jgi:xanthine dehydrogenase YagS FAD-binding subunit